MEIYLFLLCAICIWVVYVIFIEVKNNVKNKKFLNAIKKLNEEINFITTFKECESILNKITLLGTEMINSKTVYSAKLIYEFNELSHNIHKFSSRYPLFQNFELDNNWNFDPIVFGFAKTEDPWIFNTKLYEYENESLNLEKTTTGVWILTHHINDGTFMIVETIYRGLIPTRAFADQLFDNTGMNELIEENY